MALISKKKISFKVNEELLDYLKNQGREVSTLKYQDLTRYNSSIALINSQGEDTLWETVFYPQGELEEIHYNLKRIYTNIQAHGEMSVIDHLFIERVDVCPFGNSKPFRIRIVNKMNDNFDYFYVKTADASRIYGLELEHFISPNKINYLVNVDTLIEEHIAGIPGHDFAETYLKDSDFSRIRIAKEFVKFNERCFFRLLGDMHSSNFVVDITPDFEETRYRIRAIDFDQQSYEGRKNVYMPQFFKQNLPFVKAGMEVLTSESMYQYQLEERSLIRSRIKSAEVFLNSLLTVMSKDEISLPENVINLKTELSKHHKEPKFLKCRNMGEIVMLNLKMLWKSESLHFKAS